MKFSDLAKVFQKIESTASRNEKTEILAKLFTDSSEDEIEAVVYLSLGRLRPLYNSLEFNLAEKMVIRTISWASGRDVSEVTASFKKIGDLGDVAEEIMEKVPIQSGFTHKPELIVDDLPVLGSVADKSNKEMEVVRVYQNLRKIAEDEGTGSQERKIRKLGTLLKNLDGRSAKYVVRLVAGKLRLGFSDKTVLDALSYMEHGTKEGRKDLDQAYQVFPDVGVIARIVKEKGTSHAKDSVKVTIGTPVVPALAQRLRTAKEMIDKMGEVIVEPKFDGTRVQVHFSRFPVRSPRGRDFVLGENVERTQLAEVSRSSESTEDDSPGLKSVPAESKTKDEMQNGLFGDEGGGEFVRTFTRNLDENSHMFPELAKMGSQIKAREVILDCEAVGYDPKSGKMLPFQMTITRKRKHGVGDAQSQVPLRFYVFDVLYRDGESLLNESLRKRRKILSEIIKENGGSDVLFIDEYIVTDNSDKVREYHGEQLAKGLEGAMVKKADGKYLPGRQGWSWVKFKEAEGTQGKIADTIDAVVMGYYKGKGKRQQFGIGAFLVGVIDGEKFRTIAKIGTGLSDVQWREMKTRLDKVSVDEKPGEYDVVKNLMPDEWVAPSIVVEIAADEITKSPTHSAKRALRFPRLIKFRDDKSAREATTLKELEELEKIQG